MKTDIEIHRATSEDAPEVAIMVGQLLAEISRAIGVQAFDFDLLETTTRLEDFLTREKYFVFVARSDGTNAAGFISLYESHALYANGTFGTIPELYVSPSFRNNKLGMQLISEVKSFGISRGWTRLEVTTPPLPQFERSLQFYENLGFGISGGRKLKIAL